MRAHWRHLANTIECASFGPPESTTQTANRSVQSFFAGLTTVTDRPTDHATRSTTIDRIFVRRTAMRPINSEGMKDGADEGLKVDSVVGRVDIVLCSFLQCFNTI